MAENQFVRLRHNLGQGFTRDLFSAIQKESSFSDLTIICVEEIIAGHRIVLAAWSSCYRHYFKANPTDHSSLNFPNVFPWEMEVVMTVMYTLPDQISVLDAHTFERVSQLLHLDVCLETLNRKLRQFSVWIPIRKVKFISAAAANQSSVVAEYFPGIVPEIAPPERQYGKSYNHNDNQQLQRFV